MEKMINEMLSDLVVFYHKLQCYHWYVKGTDFFEVHEKLEECYDEIRTHIDEVAEAGLMVGISSEARLSEFIKQSSIKEGKCEFVTSKDIIKDILADYQHLLESTIALKKEAEENESFLISVKTDELIECYSKKVWVLSQFQM